MSKACLLPYKQMGKSTRHGTIVIQYESEAIYRQTGMQNKYKRRHNLQIALEIGKY